MDRERKRQVEDLSSYLKDFLNINANIRNEKISADDPEEHLKIMEKVDIPKIGRDSREVGDELLKHVLNQSTSLQHPRFFAFVCSAVSPYSIAGSFLTDIYNINAAAFEFSPCAGLIEEKIIRWMGSRAGFDEKCGGIFTSGGSLSNLTCMIAAREKKLPGREDLPNAVAFFSDQAHSSIVKGLHMMGLRNDQCIKIESDDQFRIRMDLLEDAVKQAIVEGKKPFLLVGGMGTTNTGSIDPLDRMAELAEKYGMWLHVDGAYGGSILFSDIYSHLAKGIERADSLSWDLHKWSLQTYSCSCAIARNKQDFITAFNEHPEYLVDVRSADHNDGWDLGIEMSRPARAIKFWYTIQALGTDRLADVIDYGFYNSKQAEEALEKLPDWEIVSKPMCGTINFRYVPKEVDPAHYDALNAAISKKIISDGYAYIVTTVLKGKRVLRLCAINGNTETADVLNTIEKLNEIAKELKSEF